jgi:hypothetical protein
MKRVIAYGGGVDSFAMLLKAIERGDHIDAVGFVDVGDRQRLDPAEWPETYQHIEQVVRPLCAAHGIPFIIIDSERYPIRPCKERPAGWRSLYDWLWDRTQIPVAGPNRICTRIAKVERFERWLADEFPDQEVEVWVGFEAGEEARAAKDPNAGGKVAWKPGQAVRINRFPLIELGLCRCRCVRFIQLSGHPVPPGSACVFCPYATRGDWKELARRYPARFAQVVEMEARKREKPTAKGFILSIMGFRKKKDAAGNVVSYRAPALPEWIQGNYQPRATPCRVCGDRKVQKLNAGCADAA